MSNNKPNTKDIQSIATEVSELRSKKNSLSSQVTELQKEVHCLKIERDIYEKAAEIIKKTRALIFKLSQIVRRPKLLMPYEIGTCQRKSSRLCIWSRAAIAIR